MLQLGMGSNFVFYVIKVKIKSGIDFETKGNFNEQKLRDI